MSNNESGGWGPVETGVVVVILLVVCSGLGLIYLVTSGFFGSEELAEESAPAAATAPHEASDHASAPAADAAHEESGAQQPHADAAQTPQAIDSSPDAAASEAEPETAPEADAPPEADAETGSAPEPEVAEPTQEEPDPAPAAEEPAAEESVVEEPAAEEPAAEEPVEEPAAEEPAAEEPVEEPAADESTEEPAAEEPTEEPAAEEPGPEPEAEDPAAEEPVAPASLADIQGLWQLIELEDGQPLAPDTEITAEFFDDQVRGFAGCNRYLAPVATGEAQALSVGPVVSFQRACPDPLLSQETTYLTRLENVTGAGLLADQLLLTYDIDGTPGQLVFAPQD